MRIFHTIASLPPLDQRTDTRDVYTRFNTFIRREIAPRPEPTITLDFNTDEDGERWAYAGSGSPLDVIDWDSWPGDVYRVRTVFTEHLSPEKILLASGCLGYALRKHIRGEELSDPTVNWTDGGLTVLDYYYDGTKTQSDDPDWMAMFDDAALFIREGTPIRKTDRAGEGTKGTRLSEGIGDVYVTFYVS